ncbi:hypothetical protein LF63_0106930 [Oleiagrimonas soli]|nr:hypothetical protein LF63_0106930 [Oleiagrimonas soli]
MPSRSPRLRSAWLRLLRAYAPLRERGMLLDPAPHHPVRAYSIAHDRDRPPASATSSAQELPLAQFLSRLRELQKADSEPARRRAEQALLTLAEPLKCAGVFELIRIEHPAIAAMVRDHLAAFGGSPSRRCA